MVATRSDADDPGAPREVGRVGDRQGAGRATEYWRLDPERSLRQFDWHADDLATGHLYAACAQHGPNEHLLGSVAREALGMMTGVFWDAGEAALVPFEDRKHFLGEERQALPRHLERRTAEAERNYQNKITERRTTFHQAAEDSIGCAPTGRLP